MKVAPENKAMEGRWHKPADTPQITAILKVSAGTTAKKWLAESAPEHWARPMFDRF